MARYINRVFIQGKVIGQVSVVEGVNPYTSEPHKIATVGLIVKNLQHSKGVPVLETASYRLVCEGLNADYVASELHDGMTVVVAGSLRSTVVMSCMASSPLKVTDIFVEFISVVMNDVLNVPATKVDRDFEITFNYPPTAEEYQRALITTQHMQDRARPYDRIDYHATEASDNRYSDLLGIPDEFYQH